jgi:hypothetical protein
MESMTECYEHDDEYSGKVDLENIGLVGGWYLL